MCGGASTDLSCYSGQTCSVWRFRFISGTDLTLTKDANGTLEFWAAQAFTGNIIPGRRSLSAGLTGLREQPAPAEVARDLPQVGDGPAQPSQTEPDKE